MPTARGSWRRVGKAEVNMGVDADMVEEKLEEEEEKEAEEEKEEEEAENSPFFFLTTITWQVGNQPPH